MVCKSLALQVTPFSYSLTSEAPSSFTGISSAKKPLREVQGRTLPLLGSSYLFCRSLLVDVELLFSNLFIDARLVSSVVSACDYKIYYM